MMSSYYNDNGELHREDGPAVVNEDGESWYLNGALHREDGPAVISKDGRKAWCVKGELHREDGPAVIHEDGRAKVWYINGKQCNSSKEYQESANLTNEEMLIIVIKYGDI